MLNINPTAVQEMKDCIASGDLNLAERRATFARIAGRETKLDDERLIEAISATDDDDDDLFVKNVVIHENNVSPQAA